MDASVTESITPDHSPATPQETETGHGRIDPDAAIAFALATNDPNPVYAAGAAVPPLFTCCLVRSVLETPSRAQTAAGAVTGARGIVHGAHEVTFGRPVRSGETLHYSATRHSLRQTRAGAVATLRIVVSAPDGEAVAEHLWSTVHLGGAASTEYGPPAGGRPFPDGAATEDLDTVVTDIAVDQAFRYAGVSGDHNPHAVDGAAARAEGFPGRILQGVCTMAMCSGAVVQVAAAGDPSRLRRFGCRMTAPVLAGEQLAVTIRRVSRQTDAGVELIGFEARAGGRTVIRHGFAEIGSLPGRTSSAGAWAAGR